MLTQDYTGKIRRLKGMGELKIPIAKQKKIITKTDNMTKKAAIIKNVIKHNANLNNAAILGLGATAAATKADEEGENKTVAVGKSLMGNAKIIGGASYNQIKGNILQKTQSPETLAKKEKGLIFNKIQRGNINA